MYDKGMYPPAKAQWKNLHKSAGENSCNFNKELKDETLRTAGFLGEKNYSFTELSGSRPAELMMRLAIRYRHCTNSVRICQIKNV